jgi:hypothetical protein
MGKRKTPYSPVVRQPRVKMERPQGAGQEDTVLPLIGTTCSECGYAAWYFNATTREVHHVIWRLGICVMPPSPRRPRKTRR